jgi:hypothetical protein
MKELPDMHVVMDNLAAFIADEACNPWLQIGLRELPTAAPESVYADEALDYWGEFFIINNLRARGILFETFMHAPAAIAEAVVFHQALPLPPNDEHYPPLARQRQAAAPSPLAGEGRGEGEEGRGEGP